MGATTISQLLDSLLTTPHREMDAYLPLHQAVLDQDPTFYKHLAVWYSRNGEVRDHNELFLGHLLVSESSDLREIGAWLLQEMAPYQVARVVDFLKRKQGRLPRSTRTAITRYLRKREADPFAFDRAAVRSKKAMKTLYASLHIKPDQRADAILFKNEPPQDSLAFIVKQLAVAPPQKQARLIRQHAIPWAIGVGVVSEPDWDVYLALVENMTGAEIVNNLKALKNRGLLANPQASHIIKRKLEQVGAGAAAYKPRVALEAGAEDHSEPGFILNRLTDQKIKRYGRLDKPTTLLVDKSQSMEQALKVGARLAAMVSGITQAPLRVFAIDGLATPVKADGPESSHWEQAFQRIKAGGCTSLGIGLEAAQRARFYMEQVIVVSDMRENTEPFFLPAYRSYSRALSVSPRVVLLQLGNGPNELHEKLRGDGVPTHAMTFNGDYYALPNMIPFLVQPSMETLIAKIRATPLPVSPNHSP